jgi:ketosteroid isomerase-like protein
VRTLVQDFSQLKAFFFTTHSWSALNGRMYDATTKRMGFANKTDLEWARAVTAGDGAALTALYTSDATLLPPNEPVYKGEAVGKYNDDMTSSFSGPTELTTTVVGGQGDVAYAVGVYRATLTPKKAGAKPLPTEEGKYLEVLKKQADGSWKIVYDMWSPNAPPGKQ